VTFEKDGYVSVQKPISIADNGRARLEVSMKAETPAVMVDVTAGGEATGPRNAKVTIPTGALVTKAGAAVTGEVAVHLTPLDPSIPAELAAYPGDLRADRTDGSTVFLETFGVM